MNVATTAIDFKREHPHNYWVRIVCLAFCLVFLALWAMGDAEGAVVQSTYNETDNSYPIAQETIKATHTKDDLTVIAFTPDGDALTVAYRERGGSWNYTTVHDAGDANSYKCGGVINTLNNSIVILASYITTTYHDLHMWIKFPADGWETWTDIAIYSGTPGRLAADIAINDTEQICAMSTMPTSSYYLRYWYYDFPTLNKVYGGSNGAEVGPGSGAAAGGFYSVQVIANLTGKFCVFFNFGTQHWWRDLDLTVALTAIAPANYYISMVAILSNDRFVAAGHYTRTGRPYLYWQDEHMDVTWTRTYVEAGTRSYESEAMGISVRQNSTAPTLISYCNTDERLTTWEAEFDAEVATWQGSQTDTGVSDADDIAIMGNFGGLWPEHPSTGIRWTRPTAGWAVLGRDESGGTDELDYIHDGVNWTVDLTTGDPNITTVSLPDAVYGEFYEHTLTKENGTTPWVWSILIKPAWMSIGAANGTIYGTPDGTGTEQVRVKLADAVPRYDEEQWTLTIGAASEGEDADGRFCSSTWIVVAIIGLMLFVFIGWTADRML